MVDAHVRKQLRYENLEAILVMHGWTVKRLEFEVGARGYLAQSVLAMLKALGLSHSERKNAQTRMSETALLCSYIIFASHRTRLWSQARLMTKYLMKPSGGRDESGSRSQVLGNERKTIAELKIRWNKESGDAELILVATESASNMRPGGACQQ